jgi:PAS domain S-box-containing protein
MPTETIPILEHQQLLEQLHLLQTVLDHSPDWVFVKDQHLRYIFANQAFADALGKPVAEILGKQDLELALQSAAGMSDRDQPISGCHQDDIRVLSGESIHHPDAAISIADLPVWHRDLRKLPLRDQHGNITGIIGFAKEPCDRQVLETALIESETKFCQFVETAASMTFEVTPEGDFSYVSPNFKEVMGYDVAELQGQSWLPLLHPADVASCSQALQTLRQDGQAILELEYRFRHQNGTWRWHNTNFSGLRDAQDQVSTVLGVADDVTDRKLAEATLIASETKFRLLVENANDLITTWNLDTIITYLSPQFKALTGYEPEAWVGRSFMPLIHPDDLENTAAINQRSAETGESTVGHEFRIKHQQNAWIWATINFTPVKDAQGKVTGFQGIVRDIDERKAAESVMKASEAQLRQQAEALETALTEIQRTQLQLVQSEKMSSLGQLVAGVAHEINNPVNFIHGNIKHANDYVQDLLDLLELYRQAYPHPVSPIAEWAEEIDIDFLIADLPKLLTSMRIGTERIRQIVLSLRIFSRMDEAECKNVDLHEGIDSTLLILQHRLKASGHRPETRVVKDYGNLPPVECYAGPMNQVFMNVLSNAIDALEEAQDRDSSAAATAPPTITIQTMRLEPNRVVIYIRDNGLGMPDSVRQRLFDPFFTTKSVGKGTGMGLSISYQIVTERHGGSLDCRSTLGQGAEFIITIPCQQNTAVECLEDRRNVNL